MKTVIDETKIRAATKSSASIAETLRKLGLTRSPSHYRRLNHYVKYFGIDISHFTGRAHGTSRAPGSRSLSDYLVLNGPYIGSSQLKKKLYEAGILEPTCRECNLGAEWNGKPLSLQLDHIDGNCSNNQISNLRILCPNCHTQTNNWTGKNSKRYKHPPANCRDCGVRVSNRSTRCHPCHSKKLAVDKVVWPSPEVLLEALKNTSYVHLAKQYGVTDNGLRKYLLRSTGNIPKKRKL